MGSTRARVGLWRMRPDGSEFAFKDIGRCAWFTIDGSREAFDAMPPSPSPGMIGSLDALMVQWAAPSDGSGGWITKYFVDGIYAADSP